VVLAEGTDSTEPTELTVLYILTSGIYLDGGESEGIKKGIRFQLDREGEPVGELEVVHVAADRSACRIVEVHRPIEIGDRAVAVSAPARPGVEALSTVAERLKGSRGLKPQSSESSAIGQDSPSTGQEVAAQTRQGLGLASGASVGESPGTARITRRGSEAVSLTEVPFAKSSGSISARLHRFADDSPAGRDFAQSTLQLNLRMQEIGGAPLSMRLRMRTRENSRDQSDGSVETDRRDRLYEMSLNYEPPEGRFSFQLGRLRSGPLVGFDYLDGVVAELKVANRFKVGGFYGNRPDIDSTDFASTGSSYGVFVHYRKKRSRDHPFYAEFLLGGIGERGVSGELSREFVSLYARLGSGSRWSLYQRAEIDLNRGWRKEVAGDSYQVSNLLIAGTYRFSKSLRMGVTYDLRRRYRDLDDRDTPEEVFDDQLRDGLRVTWYLGDHHGWRASTSIGRRRLQSSGENTDTFNGSIYNSDVAGKDLLLGVDFSGYSGPSSEGFRVSFRSRKYFSGGHDVGLLVGTSETRSGPMAETRENRWVRLTGTTRLPKGFFVLWEVEQSEGDDFGGLRTVLQLGLRF